MSITLLQEKCCSYTKVKVVYGLGFYKKFFLLPIAPWLKRLIDIKNIKHVVEVTTNYTIFSLSIALNRVSLVHASFDYNYTRFDLRVTRMSCRSKKTK